MSSLRYPKLSACGIIALVFDTNILENRFEIDSIRAICCYFIALHHSPLGPGSFLQSALQLSNVLFAPVCEVG